MASSTSVSHAFLAHPSNGCMMIWYSLSRVMQRLAAAALLINQSIGHGGIFTLNVFPREYL